MLILYEFIAKLLPLSLQIFWLFLQSIELDWVLFPTKEQFNLVGEVIIKILSHIKFLLHYLQLILQRLIRVLHLNILLLILATTIPTRNRLRSPNMFRTGFIHWERITQNRPNTKIKPTIIKRSVVLSRSR